MSDGNRSTRRTRGLVFGRIAGAPLIATPSWAIVTAVVAFWYAGLITPGAQRPIGLVLGLAAVLTLAVLIHELAHGVTALLFGHRPLEYVLSFGGGHTLIDYRTPNPWHGAAVSAIGPLSNLAQAGLAHVILGQISTVGTWTTLLEVSVVFNLALAIFNGIPALPLDGGHMVVDLVRGITGRAALAWRTVGYLGRILALSLVGAAIAVPLVLGRDPSLFILVWAIIIAGVVWQGAHSGIVHARRLRRAGYK